MVVMYHKKTKQGTYYINIADERFYFPKFNEPDNPMCGIKYDENIFNNIDKAFDSEDKNTQTIIFEFTPENVYEVDSVIEYVKNKMEEILKRKEILNRFIDGNKKDFELNTI